MIISVDFDSTIFKSAGVQFPLVGEIIPDAAEVLKELKEQGHTLVLWTCRVADNFWSLERAKDALSAYGVEFDYFNELPDQEHLSVKISADVYIDDKALGCPLIYYRTPCGHEAPYVNWKKVREWFNLPRWQRGQ